MQDIHVYERLPAPAASDNSSVWADTARFYLIGLGGRGQKALQELGAWEPVKRRSVIVLGRKDWAPGAGVDALSRASSASLATTGRTRRA